ncbi:MAG TPA: dockerin type I domain-containing protein, partial [candidate division Zixibacteria bacterium]|nr:dockerin type I domain-containing protein [candidate division Zixibacteria bacterium]
NYFVPLLLFPLSAAADPPAELVFSTYIGGYGIEWVLDIEFDDSLNIYFSGATSSADFPFTAPDSIDANVYSGWFAKANLQTGALVFARALAAAPIEVQSNIDLDAQGAILLAGSTASADFPVSGGYQGAIAGGIDGYVVSYSANGDTLKYSTFLGGARSDHIRGMEVDPASGDIFVCGWTTSADFPQSGAPTQMPDADGDLFVALLTSDLQNLVYSRLYGGSGADSAVALELTDDGTLVVAITTTSSDFVTVDTLGGADLQSADGVVLWLSASDGALQRSTRIGGGAYEDLRTVRVDSAGRALIAGLTESPDLPVKNAYQAFYAGDGDGWLAFFEADGDSLIYSGYLGGSRREFIIAAGVDNAGYAYVTGPYGSGDVPTWRAFQDYKDGTVDPIAAKVNLLAPSVAYVSYCGGWWYQGSSSGRSAPGGEFCFGGITKSTDYPLAKAFQTERIGPVYDAFLSCVAPVSGAETCCRVAGDVGHDGSVNISDATQLISYIFSDATPPVCPSEADANADAGVNIADVTALLAWIFSGGPAPMCPL